MKRHRIILGAILLLASLAVGLTACGDDDSGAADSTTIVTSAQSPERAYATALSGAGGAFVDLGAAIASGDDPTTVASSIRESLSTWEQAIAEADAADLTNEKLAGQRDALVASSGDFTAAWSAVADQWEGGEANGILELVQQRSAIAGGVEALAAAAEGAVEIAGAEAQDVLEGLQEQIDAGLDEIQSQE